MAVIFNQGYCAYAQDLKAKDDNDAFRSPWNCVNEYYDKSKREVQEEVEKSRARALKSELWLLPNALPGVMWLRVAKKQFWDKEESQ